MGQHLFVTRHTLHVTRHRTTFHHPARAARFPDSDGALLGDRLACGLGSVLRQYGSARPPPRGGAYRAGAMRTGDMGRPGSAETLNILSRPSLPGKELAYIPGKQKSAPQVCGGGLRQLIPTALGGGGRVSNTLSMAASSVSRFCFSSLSAVTAKALATARGT